MNFKPRGGRSGDRTAGGLVSPSPGPWRGGARKRSKTETLHDGARVNFTQPWLVFILDVLVEFASNVLSK